MRPEYDFSGAVRGKYYKRYLEGTNVVVLEPDVAKGFNITAWTSRGLKPSGTTSPSPAKTHGKTTAKSGW